MAKSKKTAPNGDKPAKQASNLFHNIMAASVKSNPKPKIKKVTKSKKNKLI